MSKNIVQGHGNGNLCCTRGQLEWRRSCWTWRRWWRWRPSRVRRPKAKKREEGGSAYDVVMSTHSNECSL